MIIDIRSGRTGNISTFYEATELLGEGRFAEVYKAYDLYHKTDVAIKIYVAQDDTALSMAVQEIGILEKLNTINLEYFPRVNAGLKNHKRHPVIAMELGEYSDSKITRNVLSLGKIIPSMESSTVTEVEEFWVNNTLCKFISGLCDAVVKIHQQHIVHRDLKPNNILIKRSPGEERIKPFIVDFNTSARQGEKWYSGGTQKYLPPEVVSGKRPLLAEADDLWAIAMTIWELFYGVGSNVGKGMSPHSLIKNDLHLKYENILLKALSPNLEERYQTAADFCKAIEDSTRAQKPSEDNLPVINEDQVSWARMRREYLIDDCIELLSGENELPVQKETKDKITFIYSQLTQGETESYNLKDDILRLGPKAIPAIIAEGYNIPAIERYYNSIIDALKELANINPALGKKAIIVHTVSSDYTVRKMCFDLCDSLQYFPNNLMESLFKDENLYTYEERVRIADLCIQYCDDILMMLPLNLYMCRVYILDKSKYFTLRDTMAIRAKELKFKKRAELIIQDVKRKEWEELEEYKRLQVEEKADIDKGLLELFADAFSSLSDEALELVKRHRVPEKDDSGNLNIASRFIGKLALRHDPARLWLFHTLREDPGNNALYNAALSLKRSLSNNEKIIIKDVEDKRGIRPPNDIDFVFDMFLDQGRRTELNQLRENWPTLTLSLISERIVVIRQDKERIKRMINLMRSYKNTLRQEIVNILLQNWHHFAEADYDNALYLLTSFTIPEGEQKRATLSLLNKDLQIQTRRQKAREGIDKILNN